MKTERLINIMKKQFLKLVSCLLVVSIWTYVNTLDKKSWTFSLCI